MTINRTIHKWTRRDREYLVLLKLKHSRKEIAPIFNHLLSGRLAREGFQRGMSAPSLDAQFQEMKAGGNGHDIYAQIFGLSERHLTTEYRDHLREIDTAIHVLRLRARPGSRASRRSTTTRANTIRRNRASRPNSAQAINETDTSPAPDHVPIPTRARLKQFAHQLSPYFATNSSTDAAADNANSKSQINEDTTVPPFLRIRVDINGNETRVRPLLLFRSTDNPNTFRARRFSNRESHVPPPAEFNSKEYRSWALPHLERCHAYQSPFLSFANRANNAIGRIEIAKSEDFDSKNFLAIFAFNDVEANAARNFGPGAGPHPVKALFRRGEESYLPSGYTGGGEWLVWGFIDCEPIAVFDTMQAINLARAVRRFKAGDVTALSNVSTCLRDIPLKWREAVAYAVLRNYCSSKLPRVSTPAYTRMMQTIVKADARPMTELVDLSRLSMTDDVSDEEEEEDDDETTDNTGTSREGGTPHLSTANISTAAVKSAPAGSQVTLPACKNSTIVNLNSFNVKTTGARPTRRAIETTPLWSPDASEEPATSQMVLETSFAPTKSALRSEIVNGRDDNDEDWDLINDDLEDSFAASFPSAAKRAQKLQPITGPLDDLIANFDDESEEEEYVMLSIETDKPSDDSTSSSRGNFLRGLTEHAISESPPQIETQSKAPRHAIASRTLNTPQDRVNPSARKPAPSAKQALRSGPYQPSRLRRTTEHRRASYVRTRPVRAIQSGLTTCQSGMVDKSIRADTSTATINPQPGTTIRTKVPVIVRKTIVDS